MDGAMLVRLIVGAAFVSAAVIAARLRLGAAGLDQPGHRSLHSRPTPHGGGMGIVVAAIAAGVWLGVGSQWLLPILVLGIVSAIDDWVHLPPWLRFSAHLGVAAVHLASGGVGGAGGFAVQVLVITWTTNAYNFMDGADGLAGSMAVCGFLAYAVALGLAGSDALSGTCLAVAAGAAAFVAFNWHPARVFMGDVGSIPLGFLAGAIGCYGVVGGIWPLWFPVLAFAPFLLDSGATLLARLTRGERVWEAHRDHYYQRMVRMGLAHNEMCLRWVGLMLVGAILAVGLLRVASPIAWGMALTWVAILVLLGRRVDVAWRAYTRTRNAAC